MTDLASPDKETIRDVFDHIAYRYDALNSILSFSIDENWREKAVRLILSESREEKSILDLGVGTGKFLSRFLQKKSWLTAAGVDFSGEMLKRARFNLSPTCRLIQADIHDLPFEDESFDLIVSSFTLRSVKNRVHFFSEVLRTLRPAGRIAFLCLTRPRSLVGRALYTPYLRFYLPFVGGLLTRDPVAYRFLSQSIQAFPAPREIAKEMETLGFQRISIFSFSLGLSTLMIAHR